MDLNLAKKEYRGFFEYSETTQKQFKEQAFCIFGNAHLFLKLDYTCLIFLTQ